MNDIHMQQIFNRYIDDFEKLNDPEHMEYYKWQIVKKFRPMMDEALETDDSAFAEKLMEALQYLDKTYAVGTMIRHKEYGDGRITDKHGTTIEVNFQNGDIRKLGIVLSSVNDIIVSGIEGYGGHIEKFRDILKKESSIRSAVSFAEKNFAPYVEYLE